MAGTLWARPTDGPPVRLDWLPSQTQLVLSVRPGDVLATDEGQRVLKALGPAMAEWLDNWTRQTGFAPRDITRWTVALSPADQGPPHVTHALEFARDIDMGPPWNAGGSESTPAGQLWRGPDTLALLRPNGIADRAVVGPMVVVREIAEQQGAAPLWPRSLEGLRLVSDSDQHVVLLGTPHFLFADGHLLWQGPLAPLKPSIAELLGPDVPAAMLSLHFQPYFFGELRLAGRPEQDAFHLGRLLVEELDTVPDQVRGYLATHSHPYWQELAAAFPEMLDYLRQQSRVAVEKDQAVLTFALPTAAAHNLVLAAELALATPVANTASGDGDDVRPHRVEDWLMLPVDLAFPQLSLEAALEELQSIAAQRAPAAATVPLRIRILGEDLKLAGITRNQQIRDLQLPTTTVADALTEIVRRGNPAAGGDVDLRSADQKLVWVVATLPGEDQPAIVITTRAAAEDRQWQLPSPFLPP